MYVFKRRVSDAELMYSQQRESDAITGALRKVEICDILKNHNGGSNELIALRQLLLRLGVEGKKVDKAVKNPEMVRFYLERKSSWSRNDWIELVNWIKTGRRH